MKNIIKNLLTLLWIAAFPFLGNAQTHLVNQGGQIVNGAGYIVLENSRLTNNGTMVNTLGTVKMMGNATDVNSSVGGSSATTFNQLEVNKTANNVQLGQNININGTLTMAGGHLDLQNFDLNLLNTANAVIGATSSRYLKTSGTGQVKMNVGSSEETFPIGNSSFNRVKVSSNGAADIIGVRVEDQVLEDLTTGSPITSDIVNRLWHITEAVNGGADFNIYLEWNAAEELADFNRATTHFSHYDGTKWTSLESGAAIGSGPYHFSSTRNMGSYMLSTGSCFGSGSPSTSMAGLDKLDICGDAILLTANTPTNGVGTWSVLSGDNMETLDDNMEAMSMFSGTYGQTYELEWTISLLGGLCPASKDQVSISFNPDTDNDNTQDCVDICAGANDSANADGDAFPDGCDCLPNQANDVVEVAVDPEFGIYISPGTYFANETLSSDGKIFGGSVPPNNVAFKAGQSITLEPGFHAEAGSEFLATIELCEPTMALLADESLTENLINKPIPPENRLHLKISPNPFSIKSKVTLELEAAEIVSVGVYNQNGHLVQRLLVNQRLEAGTYHLSLSEGQLGPGLYYVALITNKSTVVKKVIAIASSGKTAAFD